MFTRRPAYKQHRPAMSLDTRSFISLERRSADPANIRKSNPGSFVKLRGSVRGPPLTGIPPDMHQARYRKIIDDEGTDQRDDQKEPVSALALNDSGLNDSGSLLESRTIAGSSISLSLDRSIHFRVVPTAVSAWQHHNLISGQRSQPASVQRDPFSDKNGMMTVPRLLLAFSIDINPNLGDYAAGTRENYEFVCFNIDFWSGSTLPNRHNGFSSSGTRFSEHGSLQGSQTPLVRGFLPTDVPTSGFLQSFGPALYETPGNEPVVLGEKATHKSYKEFESRMSSRQAPDRHGPDSIAARRPDDGTGSVPATPVIDAPRAPVDPFSLQISAFGTSSVRVMVKRDTLQESAWAQRTIPFLVLLEYPPMAPCIEAKIKLDISTVRQNLPGVSRRTSLDFRSRNTWQVNRTSKNPPLSASAGLSRRLIRAPSHGVDDHETLVRLYPRQDPMSVISRGSGSVKDTLFESSLRRNRVATPDPSMTPAQIASSSSIRSGISSRPSLRHGRSQSAQIVPSMYRRSDTISSWTSSSDVSSGIGQKPLSPDSNMMSQSRGKERSGGPGSGMSLADEDKPISRCRSMTATSKSSLVSAGSRARSVQTGSESNAPQDSIDHLFDMVLTNWTENRMQEHTPPESIIFVHSPSIEKQFIPFADARRS